jgi:hypothetical protein
VGPAGTQDAVGKTQHSKGDFNIFEGRTVQRHPQPHAEPGHLVWADGDLRASAAPAVHQAPAVWRQLRAVARKARSAGPQPVPADPDNRRTPWTLKCHPHAGEDRRPAHQRPAPVGTLMELAQIGATAKGGVCRLTLTDLDKQGRDLVIAGRARPA